MNILSILFFLISFLVLFLSLRPNSDFFSPGRIFLLVWSIILGVTNLKLSMHQSEWSIEIWLQILIGPISFLVGVFISYMLHFNKSVLKLNSIRENSENLIVLKKRLFKAIIVLFGLFLISFIIIYLKVGDVAILSQKPWLVRKEFTMFGVGLFLHNVFLMILLTGIYFIFVKGEKLKKFSLLLFSIIAIILYAATLQRYQIMLSIFVLMILLYYTTKRINLKSVFISGTIIIAFFYFVSSFRLGELVLMIMYQIAEMKFSPAYAIFTEPYMYIAMNLENYAHAIERVQDFTYGYYTFDFVTAITGIKHWINDYYSLQENPFLITIHFNTYSAFWTYYRDFGILGIFAIPLAGGFFISNLYYSLISSPTIKKISLYGMFLYVIIFSFFNSAFGFLWFAYNLSAIFLIFKYI